MKEKFVSVENSVKSTAFRIAGVLRAQKAEGVIRAQAGSTTLSPRGHDDSCIDERDKISVQFSAEYVSIFDLGKGERI